MRRRDFIQAIDISTTWPLAARAQQTGKLPTIGVLGVNSSVWGPWTAAFIGRLRELNWIEGRTITVEYRWDEGRPERVKENATELVRHNVDVIVTRGSAVAALKQATTTIPIVFAVAVDPVIGGLVSSLARPGGNVTGLSVQQTDLFGKRLELLRGVIPQLRRLAIMANADYRESVLEVGEVQAAARTLGLGITPLEIWRTEDIAPAFETLNAQTDALYVVSDALVAANRTLIITFALSARLPTIFSYRDYVKAVVLCPTAQTSQIHSGAPPTQWTRFCMGQNQAMSRSRTDQVRVCSKSHDGKGTWTDDPGIIFVACR